MADSAQASGGAAAGDGDTAGSVYAQLIGEQVTEERQIKASLEQRGITVITTSAALVSLLFGLAAVVTANKHFVLPALGRVLLVLALLCFLAAAVQGIRTNWILSYEVAVDDLKRLASPQWWDRPSSPAERRAAEVRIAILESARAANDQKAALLQQAMVCEVAAVFFVAAAVAVILASA